MMRTSYYPWIPLTRDNLYDVREVIARVVMAQNLKNSSPAMVPLWSVALPA